MCESKPHVLIMRRLESLLPLLYTHGTVPKTTGPIPSPHSRSRYTRHNRYTWNASYSSALSTRRCHHPSVRCWRRVQDTAVLSTAVLSTQYLAHSTQPPAHTAGRHCGVLRREVRPTVGVEGADVVGAIHVSGWMYVSIGVISSFGVFVCIRERGTARAGERARGKGEGGRERKRQRERERESEERERARAREREHRS